MIMKSKKISIVILTFAALVFMGQGCITVGFGAKKVQDGGMYSSEDKGEIWKQKVFAGIVKKKTQTISNANISKILFHPLDSKIIYLGTTNSGMLVSSDSGESWKSILVSSGSVQAIGLDPTSAQILYVGLGGQIQKSTDAGAAWTVIYTQAVSGYSITAVAVDPFNPRQIFAGASNGVILKSDDSGASWKAMPGQAAKAEIRDIIFHPNDPSLMIAVTPSNGIFKSFDRGITWGEFISKETAAKFTGSLTAGVLLPHARVSSMFLYASAYGLMRTSDGGKTWEAVNLLTKPGEVKILSLAANPYDFDEVYYGTASNLYKTFNNGNEWITRSLPSSRQPTALGINPNDTGKIWMGTTKPVQKKKSLLSPL
ncbi:MAG: YCF48-related protein [Patescibacteria group bacterium]